MTNYTETFPNNPLDHQEGGSHYKNLAIQPIEFIMANNLDMCQGNIIKYVCRFRDKGGKKDLLKARHYIDLLISLTYPEKESSYEETDQYQETDTARSTRAFYEVADRAGEYRHGIYTVRT